MSNLSNIEDYLKENGTLSYTFRGSSMHPLLKQGRDIFTVAAKTSKRCSKYDVVLYRRSEHRYVLHRVIEVRSNDYVIQGDNCMTKEYGIRDEDIIGVMTSFNRNGRVYAVTDKRYRIYVRIWAAIHPIISAFQRIGVRISGRIRRCLR